MHTWLRRCSTLAGLSLAVVALTAAPASAQKKTSVGFLGGADFTTLTGLDSNVSVRSSTGFAGGLYVNFPVAKSLLIEPELIYANKGAGIKDTEITLNLNYIEIPVLLRYEFTPENAGPFAYVGPYVGFNVKCSTSVDTVSCPAPMTTCRPVPCSAAPSGPGSSGGPGASTSGTNMTSAMPSRTKRARIPRS